MIVGHDEYWSWEMRDALDAYLDNGGHLARFAGNFLWQIRLEDEGRRQVCYKYRAREEDPLRSGPDAQRTTTCWDAPEVGRPAALTMGLSGSRGLYAGWGGCVPRGPGGFTIYRPEHWCFAGSDLYYGDLLGAAARVFGYEVDAVDYVIKNGLPFPTRADGAPPGIEILGLGLATLLEENHGHHGSDLFIGDEDVAFLAETLHGAQGPEAINQMKRGAGMIACYRRGNGEVFNAGSCEWVAGLIARDPQVERVTKNVLDRYGGRVKGAERGLLPHQTKTNEDVLQAGRTAVAGGGRQTPQPLSSQEPPRTSKRPLPRSLAVHSKTLPAPSSRP